MCHRRWPRVELAHRIGLDDVVVGAKLEPDDAIGLVATRGGDDDGHVTDPAQVAQDVQTVAVG